jgi:alpha-glucosidase
MPPRFALGVWWSRYWPYTAEDLEDIARGYASHSIPLDVLVSDMARLAMGSNFIFMLPCIFH